MRSKTPRADGTGGSVDGEHAYFVHSYYAVPDDESATVATTDYGTDFASIVPTTPATSSGRSSTRRSRAKPGFASSGTTSTTVSTTEFWIWVRLYVSGFDVLLTRRSVGYRSGDGAGVRRRRLDRLATARTDFQRIPRALSLSRTRCN